MAEEEHKRRVAIYEAYGENKASLADAELKPNAVYWFIVKQDTVKARVFVQEYYRRRYSVAMVAPRLEQMQTMRLDTVMTMQSIWRKVLDVIVFDARRRRHTGELAALRREAITQMLADARRIEHVITTYVRAEWNRQHLLGVVRLAKNRPLFDHDGERVSPMPLWAVLQSMEHWAINAMWFVKYAIDRPLTQASVYTHAIFHAIICANQRADPGQSGAIRDGDGRGNPRQPGGELCAGVHARVACAAWRGMRPAPAGWPQHWAPDRRAGVWL